MGQASDVQNPPTSLDPSCLVSMVNIGLCSSSTTLIKCKLFAVMDFIQRRSSEKVQLLRQREDDLIQLF
jgi:hypothetical protein